MKGYISIIASHFKRSNLLFHYIIVKRAQWLTAKHNYEISRKKDLDGGDNN